MSANCARMLADLPTVGDRHLHDVPIAVGLDIAQVFPETDDLEHAVVFAAESGCDRMHEGFVIVHGRDQVALHPGAHPDGQFIGVVQRLHRFVVGEDVEILRTHAANAAAHVDDRGQADAVESPHDTNRLFPRVAVLLDQHESRSRVGHEARVGIDLRISRPFRHGGQFVQSRHAQGVGIRGLGRAQVYVERVIAGCFIHLFKRRKNVGRTAPGARTDGVFVPLNRVPAADERDPPIGGNIRLGHGGALGRDHVHGLRNAAAQFQLTRVVPRPQCGADEVHMRIGESGNGRIAVQVDGCRAVGRYEIVADFRDHVAGDAHAVEVALGNAICALRQFDHGKEPPIDQVQIRTGVVLCDRVAESTAGKQRHCHEGNGS